MIKVSLNAFLAALLGMIFISSALAEDPIRIMPLGDSITVGGTSSPRGDDPWAAGFSFGYRAPLYTQLTNAGYDIQFVGESGEPFGYTVNGAVDPTEDQIVKAPDLRPLDQDHHRGYGGKGSAYLKDNIASWLENDNPDLVLLMIGINDISSGSTADPVTSKTNLNAIVNTITTNCPDAHLVVAQITPYAVNTPALVLYNDYIKNTLVPSYVAQGKNVSTVDQYQALLKNDGSIDASLFSNGINHPNQEGYGNMADIWFEGINALGLPSNPVPEPSTVALLIGVGLAFCFVRRRGR